jgi:hypothetical protein
MDPFDGAGGFVVNQAESNITFIILPLPVDLDWFCGSGRVLVEKSAMDSGHRRPSVSNAR